MASPLTISVEVSSRFDDITQVKHLRLTVPGIRVAFRKEQYGYRYFNFASDRSLSPLEIFPPRTPIVFDPALRHTLVVIFRHANMGQIHGCAATRGFFKLGHKNGIWISLFPGGRAPSLHDHLVRKERQSFAANHPVKGGPFSSDLAADLGGRGGCGGVFVRIHEEFVENSRSGVVKNSPCLDDGCHSHSPRRIVQKSQADWQR